MDIYQVGFVPDIVRYELQFISQSEFEQRTVYLPLENPDALGDINGDHIDIFDFDMAHFISYLTLQKITKTFSDDKLKDYVKINKIDGNFQDKTLNISIDIAAIKDNPLIPDSFQETKKTIIGFLHTYEEFLPEINTINIKDTYSGKQRSFSLKALLESQQQD
jgi:hypothetical protein